MVDLNYSDHYLSPGYFTPPDYYGNQTYDYLTLPYNQAATTMNWHAGFFNRESYTDDNYFFLANLLTNVNKSVHIKLTPPVSGYTNYRFRNYEGSFDTTFTGTQFTYMLTHPAGEGYLYEVAPDTEDSWLPMIQSTRISHCLKKWLSVTERR